MSANIVSGGLYELRSMANTGLTQCIWGTAMTDGYPVGMLSALGYNDQKWVLTDTEQGLDIRNLLTGKNAVVWWPTAADPFVAGQPIVQWSGGGTNGHWEVADTGETAVIDNTTCQVVRFLSKGNSSLAYAFSVSSMRAELHALGDGDASQKWALLPTYATDNGIPAPHTLGVSAEVYSEAGGNVADNANPVSFTVHPFWSVAAAFASGSTFQIRYRSRYMATATSTWGAFGTWSQWADIETQQDGVRFWMSDALEVTISSTRKLAEVEFEVRTCRTNGGVQYVGAAARQSTVFYPRPVTGITSAVWSPEGLRLAVTTNYSRGATGVRFTSIRGADGELLAEEAEFTLLSSPTYVQIPQESLKGIPDNGESLSIAYYVGSDQMPQFDGSVTVTKQVSYKSGEGTGAPTLAEHAADRTLHATIASSWTEARMWVLSNGELTECERGADGAFIVMYPFNAAWKLFATGRKTSAWFAWYDDMAVRAVNAHAWNHGDGYAEITGRNVPMGVDVSTDASYKSFMLGSRPYETVSGTPTRKQQWTVDGGVFDGHGVSGRGNIDALPNKHAVYRSPYGDVVPVYVKSAKWTQRGIATAATVSMIREAE